MSKNKPQPKAEVKEEPAVEPGAVSTQEETQESTPPEVGEVLPPILEPEPEPEPKVEEEPKPTAPVGEMKTYNTTTHVVVNKAAFETMFVNLVAQRVRMYTRQNAIPKLAELLELDFEQAQAHYGELMQRVMNG